MAQFQTLDAIVGRCVALWVGNRLVQNMQYTYVRGMDRRFRSYIAMMQAT